VLKITIGNDIILSMQKKLILLDRLQPNLVKITAFFGHDWQKDNPDRTELAKRFIELDAFNQEKDTLWLKAAIRAKIYGKNTK